MDKQRIFQDAGIAPGAGAFEPALLDSAVEKFQRAEFESCQAVGELTALLSTASGVIGVKWNRPTQHAFLVEYARSLVHDAGSPVSVPPLNSVVSVMLVHPSRWHEVHTLLAAGYVFECLPTVSVGGHAGLESELRGAGMQILGGNQHLFSITYVVALKHLVPVSRISVQICSGAAALSRAVLEPGQSSDRRLNPVVLFQLSYFKSLMTKVEELCGSIPGVQKQFDARHELDGQIRSLHEAVRSLENLLNRSADSGFVGEAEQILGAVKRYAFSDPGLAAVFTDTAMAPVPPMIVAEPVVPDRTEMPIVNCTEEISAELAGTDPAGAQPVVAPVATNELSGNDAPLPAENEHGSVENALDDILGSQEPLISKPPVMPKAGGAAKPVSNQPAEKSVPEVRHWTNERSGTVGSGAPERKKPEVRINLGGDQKKPMPDSDDMYATVLVNIDELKRKSGESEDGGASG